VLKIWLDDVRPAPLGFRWVRSVNEAKYAIEAAELMNRFSGGKEYYHIECISLDHDLGDYASDGGDGIKLMDWLAERGTLYPLEFHSMNVVGMENMKRMHRRYWLGERL